MPILVILERIIHQPYSFLYLQVTLNEDKHCLFWICILYVGLYQTGLIYYTPLSSPSRELLLLETNPVAGFALESVTNEEHLAFHQGSEVGQEDDIGQGDFLGFSDEPEILIFTPVNLVGRGKGIG